MARAAAKSSGYWKANRGGVVEREEVSVGRTRSETGTRRQKEKGPRATEPSRRRARPVSVVESEE